MESNQSEHLGSSLSLAFVGGGGAGVMTAGQVLLDAAGRCGHHGLMTRSSGPQIRGGEAAAIVRLGNRTVECQDDRLDLLIALDWNHAERFASELVVDENSLVIADPDQGEIPAWIRTSGAIICDVAFAELAKAQRGVRVNCIAIGLAAALAGLDAGRSSATLRQLFGPKGERLADAAGAGFELGWQAARDLPHRPVRFSVPAIEPPDWLLTGNEAIGLGAIRAGIRFCAAYPITPSTEIQEWLASNLPKVGGQLVQVEDELASINMCMGASFGGVPAMTATSGPGLSLMVEALGLAAAAEIPLLVVNVMRGGPSTGIPTKSEQADLNLAIYGAHGDAPRLVLAPNSLGDCLNTTHWGVCLAEALQCPTIVLSDQFLSQARGAIHAPAARQGVARRRLASAGNDTYQRYALTEDGVSPMALPGMAGVHYTATGLSHQASGLPSTVAADHLAQLNKRRDKLSGYDYGSDWADIEGEGDVAVVTWGSVTGACREALSRLLDKNIKVRLVSLRLLSPLNVAGLAHALSGCSRAVVVEQSHGAQFYHYLRGHANLPPATSSFSHAGPLTLKPGQIEHAIRDALLEQAA